MSVVRSNLGANNKHKWAPGTTHSETSQTAIVEVGPLDSQFWDLFVQKEQGW